MIIYAPVDDYCLQLSEEDANDEKDKVKSQRRKRLKKRKMKRHQVIKSREIGLLPLSGTIPSKFTRGRILSDGEDSITVSTSK